MTPHGNAMPVPWRQHGDADWHDWRRDERQAGDWDWRDGRLLFEVIGEDGGSALIQSVALADLRR